MKKYLLLFVIVLILGLVIYLDVNGLVTWQPLAMALAAIAAPFRFIWNALTSTPAEIRARHASLRQKEKLYQDKLENAIGRREARIQQLDASLERLQKELDRLERQRAEIETEVNRMNAEEIKRAVWKYAGR
ncbi:MAG: hypothetical protein D6677_05485 [Calditrichaeota bacterium]|nr:MAG: hypothetical protein D6677_05485 [Calditrichota bacterium]